MNEKYWKEYYKKKHSTWRSDFAKFVRGYPELPGRGAWVLDLGCGNGRDSYYLSKKWTVIGVDNAVRPKMGGKIGVVFYRNNIARWLPADIIDIVYCRFLFHAIERELCYRILDLSSGYICIEVRSDKDYRYNICHKRLPWGKDELVGTLEGHGWEIMYVTEGRDMAKCGSENPIVIRVIGRK